VPNKKKGEMHASFTLLASPSLSSHTMGKRKSSKKPVAKKARQKLAKTFNCPFCNAAGAVECRFDRDGGTGTLACTVCAAHYAAPITSLSEEIDLYAAWIDACDEANKA